MKVRECRGAVRRGGYGFAQTVQTEARGGSGGRGACGEGVGIALFGAATGLCALVGQTCELTTRTLFCERPVSACLPDTGAFVFGVGSGGTQRSRENGGQQRGRDAGKRGGL